MEMKSLSLLEPFASLIKENIKCVETRSWKTNYRGELYIHASLKKVSKKDERINELVNLLKDKEFKYGNIIAKCKLVDCIYMDESYVNDIVNNKIEHMCGMYSVGRYAWILEDIEMLKDPIEIKGKLGIWNYMPKY
jgi:hypothetical protein